MSNFCLSVFVFFSFSYFANKQCTNICGEGSFAEIKEIKPKGKTMLFLMVVGLLYKKEIFFIFFFK